MQWAVLERMNDKAMKDRSYLTVDEVAVALDLSKEDAHKLLTKDNLKVPYTWTPTGIKVPKKAFYDLWGNGSDEVTTKQQTTDEEITMSVFVSRAMDFITAAQELGLNKSQIDKTLEWLISIGNIEAEHKEQEEITILYTIDELNKVREYLKDKKEVSAETIFYTVLGADKSKTLRGNSGRKVKALMNEIGGFESFFRNRAIWYRRTAQ